MAYDNDDQWGGGQSGGSSRRQGGYVSSSLSSMPRSPSEALEPSRGPEPPRAKKKKGALNPFFAFLNTVLTLFVIASLTAGGAYVFAQYQFSKSGPLTYSTVVEVSRGMGTSSIATMLENEGVISSRSVFLGRWYWKRFASWYNKTSQPTLKAGEYSIPKGSSINQVIEKLISGKGNFYKITIPEGLTSQQIVNRLKAHPRLKGEIVEIPAEGSLMPNTYRYSSKTERQDIIKRMQNAQRIYLAKAWKRRARGLPFKSPQEAMILASIVEKETGRVDERKHVASVFINRMRKGMRLQSDPTIIYGLVGGKGTLGRPIYRSDIRSKTEYNTYHIKGLPPTPIANVGKAAIEAVLNPAVTRDLYFVADGTGGHAFAASLKEHNANVRKWRVIEKKIRKRQAEKKAAKLAEEQKLKKIELARKRAAEVPGVSISDHAQEAKKDALDSKWPAISESITNQDDIVPLPVRRPE